jgi:hypothetical protein
VGEAIIKNIINQSSKAVIDSLNKKTRKRKIRKKFKRHKRKGTDKLSITDIEHLMRQDSYTRGPGGALRQKTWGK